MVWECTHALNKLASGTIVILSQRNGPLSLKKKLHSNVFPSLLLKGKSSRRHIQYEKRCLRTYSSKKHQNWANLIPDILQFLNEILHDTTVFTTSYFQTVCQNTRLWETIVMKPPLHSKYSPQHKVEYAAKRIQSKCYESTTEK